MSFWSSSYAFLKPLFFSPGWGGVEVQKWNDTQLKTVELGHANPLSAMVLNKTCPNYSKLDTQLVLCRAIFSVKAQFTSYYMFNMGLSLSIPQNIIIKLSCHSFI